MSTKNDGGAAFPRPASYVQSTEDVAQEGMSIRDYFAAQALAGDFSSQSRETGEWSNDATDDYINRRAAFFYRFADALLEARKKGE